jgi:hypothetical protein
MKRSLYTVAIFVKINTRRFFRDKLALFFSMGFPLIFLFVFGSLNSGNSNVSFKVAVINQSDSTFAKEFTKSAQDSKVLKVSKDITTINAAKDKMNKSELDAMIILPKEFGDVKKGDKTPSGQAEIVYTKNNEQSGQALSSVLQAQFKQINTKFVSVKEPFSVRLHLCRAPWLLDYWYGYIWAGQRISRAQENGNLAPSEHDATEGMAVFPVDHDRTSGYRAYFANSDVPRSYLCLPSPGCRKLL